MLLSSNRNTIILSLCYRKQRLPERILFRLKNNYIPGAQRRIGTYNAHAINPSQMKSYDTIGKFLKVSLYDAQNSTKSLSDSYVENQPTESGIFYPI